MGLTRPEAKALFAGWPNLDEDDENVLLLINNSLNNVLGYPGDWPSAIKSP